MHVKRVVHQLLYIVITAIIQLILWIKFENLDPPIWITIGVIWSIGWDLLFFKPAEYKDEYK
jgi:hypothetical protein